MVERGRINMDLGKLGTIECKRGQFPLIYWVMYLK